MPDANGYKISNRYLNDSGSVFLTGVQALARLPIQQIRTDRKNGLNTAAFLAGYPGSPLAGLNFEIDKARELVPDLPIVHRPVLNEEHGATAVMGSQLAAEQPDCAYDGITGLWYGKAPGLDRAGDALRHAVFTGTSRYGGAVAIVGDDPAAKSSTLPSSSDATLVDLHMPILYPGDVHEILTLGMHAISLSRITGAWTALKVVDAVADGSGTVDLASTLISPKVPDLEIDGALYEHRPDAKLLPPNNLKIEQDLRMVRSELVRRYTVANKLNPTTVDPSDAWIGLIASGFTYHELRHALHVLGLRTEKEISSAGIRLLHLQLPIPFDPENIRNFSRGLEEIIVIEEKNPTAEWLVKDALYGSAHQPRVLGKTHPDGRTLMPSHGILNADAMVEGLYERLSRRIQDKLILPQKIKRERSLIPLSTQRSPYFCSGCPHNTSTKVPEDALVGAGIGCHTMVLLMDDERVGEIAGVTAMGNEGMQWIGMEPFVDREHFIQNIGDGTYFHSGQLTIPSAIAAGSKITFKLLFNGTIAMTGGQDPKGGLDIPDVVRVMLAQGVEKIIITAEDLTRYRNLDIPKEVTLWDRSRIVEAQDVLSAIDGVTVLIHDQFCAAQLRRLRKRGAVEKPDFRVLINHRICEACGDCGEVSNCLSVQSQETFLGPKAFIEQDSCNFDVSCLKGDCPSFLTVKTTPDSLPIDQSIDMNALEDDLPKPVQGFERDHLDLRMAGIGGTGVVTAAQVLATAAMLNGFEVRGLDQTGLSQKAGPVVSDIRLTRGEPRPSNLLTKQSADVILGFDLLVASSENTLKVARNGHTILVASDSPTPTGSMVGNPYAEFPEKEKLVERVETVTNASANLFMDAAGLCKQLIGESTSANIFLLGVAVQKGIIPVEPEFFKKAIELNGVAVDKNLSAFQWGRSWADNPERLHQRIKINTNNEKLEGEIELPTALKSRIERLNASKSNVNLISLLCADLIGYQNKDCVDRYLKVVVQAIEASELLDNEDDGAALVESVARNMHKLIAYKDEYEVARLFSLAGIQSELLEVPNSSGKATWHLHPPFLRALGMNNKLRIPFKIAVPLMNILAKGKVLRGTPFDIFGFAKVRKMERTIRDVYRKEILAALKVVNKDNYDQVLALASLPIDVRGFEEIKLRRAEKFLEDLTSISKRLFPEKV